MLKTRQAGGRGGAAEHSRTAFGYSYIGLACCGVAVFWFLCAWRAAGGDFAGAPREPGKASDPSRPAPARFRFSEKPTDVEISAARLFDEPLLPSGGAVNPAENRALAQALNGYAARADLDDFSSLTIFLQQFPRSHWNGSLLLHVGVEYYNSGCYSHALEAWEKAWRQLQGVDAGPVKAQADRALGELARLYSKLGRMQELSALLESTKQRPLVGPATQLIDAAHQGLWMMQTRPETCFRCGPLALDRILAQDDPAKAANPLIARSRSTTNGFSLLQVAQLSAELGMNYQMAFRSRGANVVVPAVVHWKAGHYAALLRREGDRFFVQDSTFRNSLWMSSKALDEEASGYFLIPRGDLPAGWHAVGTQEAAQVWGRGQVNKQNADSTTKQDNTCGCPYAGIRGMAAYSMHTMLVSLSLNDTPIGYTPPLGPEVFFTARYHQREANQPATFYYSNLGPKWTCGWLAYITDNPTSTNADVSYYEDGGGTLSFTSFNPTNDTYAIERMSHGLLTRTSDQSYALSFPDGSQQIFAASDGSIGSSRRVFLTQIVDPAGNSVQLNYDPQLRITNVVDAIGQATSLLYTNALYPFAITEVIDPFGRRAFLEYDSSGRLARITDVLGLASQFTYSTNDFISALLTPYGTTAFATGVTNGVTWLQTTDPLGQSELLEFNDNTPIPGSDPLAVVPHGIGALDSYLIFRNSLYWDKKAYQEGAGDPTKARIYHFLHEVDINTESPILESLKEPLENRVWYTYLGQASGNIVGPNSKPSFTGRVLDDGTTQVRGYLYDAFGNITNATDPVGRGFSFVYATNGVDLLEIRMTGRGKNELVQSRTYNSQHRALTLTDASLQTTTNSYNPRGQLLTSTDPLGAATSLAYDANGYLLSITGPLGATKDTASFTYDGFGRVRTAADTDGHTLTFDYDAMDRVTVITLPDGTFEQFVYDRLDRVASRDRLGRWTTNTYNAARQLVQSRDPLGRTTTYDWCKCGALTGLIDPMGRTTTWRFDGQSRPVAKQYADGSTVSYTYETTTSRLKSRHDERGQDTLYEYYPDDQLKRVTYPNATVPTPTVSYTYDPDYNRLASITDGIGTAVYSYHPISGAPGLGAGLLASVVGPLANSTVTYQYDPLGRITNRAINGVAESTAFDALGRATNVVNALGTFTCSYDGATARLLALVFPNGLTANYSYLDNAGDRRLQQLAYHRADGSLISRFRYAYDPSGAVTNWLQELGVVTNAWNITYDGAGQLFSADINQGQTNLNYTELFDPAANRLQESVSTQARTFQYNALNQLLASSDAALTNATFEWDAEHRLIAVNQGANRSEFYYDGSGRRCRIIEKASGFVLSEKRYVWDDTQICEEHDQNDALLQRFFGEGFATRQTSYFYTRDHLGSVREVLDGAGQLQARYSYSPYGERTVLQGGLDAAFAFNGQFRHAASGLQLSLFRAYDPSLGRWLSRDPLGEDADINLYAYVGNDPLNETDPLGLLRFAIQKGRDFVGEGANKVLVYSFQVDFNSWHTPTHKVKDWLGARAAKWLDPALGLAVEAMTWYSDKTHFEITEPSAKDQCLQRQFEAKYGTSPDKKLAMTEQQATEFLTQIWTQLPPEIQQQYQNPGVLISNMKTQAHWGNLIDAFSGY